MKTASLKARVLLTLIVALLVIGTMTVVSFAADKTASYDNQYGQIVPTDSKLEARKTSFTFYGDKATLYFMRISEGKDNANYAVEIYSDKACTKLIRSMSGEFASSKGNTPLAIAWNFKNTESGTYYGKCYTYISRADGNVIDTDSVEIFKIKIDRLSKKTVKLNSVKNASNGVKITWSPVATATKYTVMRKADGEKKWITIQTLGKGACAFTDTSVKSGKKYTYTVRCYAGDYKSLYNKTGLSITYLSTPKLVDVDGTGSSGYAKLQWKKVTGANSYEIYRKGGSLSNSEWKKIATVKGNKTVTYTDKKATKTDWYYSYSVRAVNGSSKSTYNSDGLDFSFLRAPLLKKASSYTNGVRITWDDANEDVTKYYVYKKTSSGFKKIGTTTNKYFVDTTAKSGKSYTYTVKALCKTNDGAYNSKGIKANYLAMPKLGSVTFDASNRAKITWSKVSNADSYKVYRKINSASKWTEIATVKGGSKVSYLDKVAKKSGYTYQYTVKAFAGKVSSYCESVGAKNMYLSVPTVKLSNTATSAGELRVKVTWNAIKGSKGYNVYRRPVGTSQWTYVAKNIAALSVLDSGAKNGVRYEYTVRAVNGSSMSRYTTVQIIALNRPVLKDAVITDKGVSISWDKVNGADTYYVYRRTEGGKWSVIGSYSLNSFIDTSKESKTKPFYYTVIAEADGYKSTHESIGVKNFVSVPEIKAEFVPATEAETPYIMVNWAFDATIDSIELFKSIGDDKVSLGVFGTEMGVTQYKDQDIAIGTEYTYTAKAIKAGKVSTEKSAKAEFPHAPLEVVEFDATPVYSEDGSYITVEFAPVEFAEGYEIFRKNSAAANWKKIGTVKKSEIEGETYIFTDVDVDEETAYYYTVKAVASDRDSLYNEAGISAIVYIPVEAPAGVIAKEETVDDKTVAVITWDRVQYAELYKVLRKTANSEWEVLGEVSAENELKFVDETIEEGIEYTYTILAKAENRGEAINEIGACFCWGTPVIPEEPETPTEPDVPTGPENPTDPGNPDNSENLEVPDNPGGPTVPDVPEIEDVPDAPVEGEEVEGPTAEEII